MLQFQELANAANALFQTLSFNLEKQTEPTITYKCICACQQHLFHNSAKSQLDIILKMPKNMRVCKKAFVLMLMPILIFLWLIGWTFYWAGSKKQLSTHNSVAETDPTVTVIMLPETCEECSV